MKKNILACIILTFGTMLQGSAEITNFDKQLQMQEFDTDFNEQLQEGKTPQDSNIDSADNTTTISEQILQTATQRLTNLEDTEGSRATTPASDHTSTNHDEPQQSQTTTSVSEDASNDNDDDNNNNNNNNFANLESRLKKLEEQSKYLFANLDNRLEALENKSEYHGDFHITTNLALQAIQEKIEENPAVSLCMMIHNLETSLAMLETKKKIMAAQARNTSDAKVFQPCQEVKYTDPEAFTTLKNQLQKMEINSKKDAINFCSLANQALRKINSLEFIITDPHTGLRRKVHNLEYFRNFHSNSLTSLNNKIKALESTIDNPDTGLRKQLNNLRNHLAIIENKEINMPAQACNSSDNKVLQPFVTEEKFEEFTKAHLNELSYLNKKLEELEKKSEKDATYFCKLASHACQKIICMEPIINNLNIGLRRQLNDLKNHQTELEALLEYTSAQCARLDQKTATLEQKHAFQKIADLEQIINNSNTGLDRQLNDLKNHQTALEGLLKYTFAQCATFEQKNARLDQKTARLETIIERLVISIQARTQDEANQRRKIIAACKIATTLSALGSAAYVVHQTKTGKNWTTFACACLRGLIPTQFARTLPQTPPSDPV